MLHLIRIGLHKGKADSVDTDSINDLNNKKITDMANMC